MFDGNHRARRDINLSGGNSRRLRSRHTQADRTTEKSRSLGVLDKTRILREERRQIQLKNYSATKIQKMFRGLLARNQTLQVCRKSEINHDYIRAVLQLSMALSLVKTNQSSETMALAQLCMHKKNQENSSLPYKAKQRLLQRALLDVVNNTTTANHVTLRLWNLIEFCIEVDSTPLSVETFCLLIEIFQRLKMSTEWNEKLWRWCCKVAASKDKDDSLHLAYISMTIFCFGADEKIAATYFEIEAENVLRWSYEVLLKAMITRLTDERLCRMMLNKEAELLRRVLKVYQTSSQSNAHLILELVDFLLPTDSLNAILIAHQIRGQSMKTTLGDDKNIEDANSNDYSRAEEVNHEDQDDEKDLDEFSRTRTESLQKGRLLSSMNSSKSRLSRQQILTVARLNQLYQEDWNVMVKHALNALSRSDDLQKNIVDLADLLTENATLWQRWGVEVLTGASHQSQKLYLQLLGRLLQGCSGHKTSNISPFMSKLASSTSFLEALWTHSLLLMINGTDSEGMLCICTTIFCDIFSHHLISLSDKDFLASYAHSSNSNTVIVAEQLVTHLKSLLHNLYFIKPIVASDVKVSQEIHCQRARLLLSATKAWNSLYERWSRLIHQAPFCDESSWWFPRLASRDDKAAVVHTRERNVQGNEDAMDIDESDDEDDAMDSSRTENDLENDALAETFRDPIMARILTCIPQAIPFDRRVKLFSSLLAADKLQTQDENAEFRRAVTRMMQQDHAPNEFPGSRERVEIHRDQIYSDSMKQLNSLGPRLKSKIQVTMINKHGAHEAGIDGGGVFKEFLDDLIKEAFSPKENQSIPPLFTVTPMETLAINIELPATKDNLSHYEFMGRVLGKSVYESILVEPQFCLPFLNQLLGKQNSLEDFKNFDLVYYNNLMKLRTLTESEIQDLGLSFELDVSPRRSVLLIRNGSSIPVTKQTVIHYIHLVANQRLNVEGSAQTAAFLRGFRDLIPASWVRLFSAYELQKLISGDDSIRGIDVANLKSAMQYSGGYHPSQPIMIWFWEVIDDLTPDQQRKFLRFMTSCSRQPLLGFHALTPLPCIQQIRIPSGTAPNDAPLPSSSTCMNLLKLPNYSNKSLLQKKLLAAIEAGAGFELT
jgi:ubiquitin-protein ligase E3 C